MRHIYLLLLTILALFANAAPAGSVYEVPRNKQLTYAVEITQRFKMSTPWTGDLILAVNDDGLLSGQYRSNSIRPDPFYGKTVLIHGSVSGEHIRIYFNTSGRTSVKGDISEDKIVGTFYDPNMKTYDFNAIRVTRE